VAISRLRLDWTAFGYKDWGGATQSFGLYVPAGSNRVLVVTIAGIGYTTFSNLRFNNLPLTLAVRRENSYNDVEIWYLLNPPAGSYTFTLPLGRTDAALGLATYSGVDQSNPLYSIAGYDRYDRWHILGSCAYPKDGLVIHGGVNDCGNNGNAHMYYASGPMTRIVSQIVKTADGSNQWHVYQNMGEYIRSGAAGSQSWDMAIPYERNSQAVQAIFNPAPDTKRLCQVIWFD